MDFLSGGIVTLPAKMDDGEDCHDEVHNSRPQRKPRQEVSQDLRVFVPDVPAPAATPADVAIAQIGTLAPEQEGDSVERHAKCRGEDCPAGTAGPMAAEVDSGGDGCEERDEAPHEDHAAAGKVC